MIDFNNEFNELSLNEIITICELQEHLFSLTNQSLISTVDYVANSMFSETKERVSQLCANILNCMKIYPAQIPLYTFFFKELIARKTPHNNLGLISQLICNPFPSINTVLLPRYSFLNECIKFEILQEQEIVKAIRRYFDQYSHSLLPWKYAFAWFTPSIYKFDRELYNSMLETLKDDLKQTEIRNEMKQRPAEPQNSFVTFFNSVFTFDNSPKKQPETDTKTEQQNSNEPEQQEKSKMETMIKESSYHELSAFVKILPELQHNDWEMHKIVMSSLYYPETIEFIIREDRVSSLIQIINKYEEDQRKEIDRIIKQNENEYEYDYEYVDDDEVPENTLIQQSAPVIKPKRKRIVKIEDTGDDIDADENSDDYSSSSSSLNEQQNIDYEQQDFDNDNSNHFDESNAPHYHLEKDDEQQNDVHDAENTNNENYQEILHQNTSNANIDNHQNETNSIEELQNNSLNTQNGTNQQQAETNQNEINTKSNQCEDSQNEISLTNENRIHDTSEIKQSENSQNEIDNNATENICPITEQNSRNDKQSSTEIVDRILSKHDQLPAAKSSPVFSDIDTTKLSKNSNANQNSVLIPKKRKKIKINRRPSLHKTVPEFIPFDVNQRIRPSVFEKNEFLRYWPTLVQFSTFHGSAHCLAELINRGADLSLTDYAGKRIAMFAIANGNLDIIQYLEYHNIDFSGTLQIAALFNKQDAFLRLIQTERFRLDEIDPRFGSVLHQAAAANNIRTMIYCIERGINVNIRDNNDAAPLYYAAENRQLDATLFLSDHKQIDANAKTKNGVTPLMMACKKNFVNGVKAILGIKTVNINEVDNFNSTALHYAVMANAIRIVNELCSVEGIDFTIKDSNKQTAVDLAYENGFDKCAQIIKDKQNSCTIC